jgi:hypothetical protein
VREVRSTAEDFIGPPVEGDVDFVMERNVPKVRDVDGTSHGRGDGTRIDHKLRTENRTGRLGLFSLFRGALLLALSFLSNIRLRCSETLFGNEKSHEYGQRPRRVYRLLGADEESLVFIGVREEG